MSVVELERRGQKNPCFCDACRDVEGARKRAEKGEKEERERCGGDGDGNDSCEVYALGDELQHAGTCAS
jgi:hypothetical protein